MYHCVRVFYSDDTTNLVADTQSVKTNCPLELGLGLGLDGHSLRKKKKKRTKNNKLRVVTYLDVEPDGWDGIDRMAAGEHWQTKTERQFDATEVAVHTVAGEQVEEARGRMVGVSTR